MKTIVLGYSNDKATGPATVLAGPEVSIADQVKLVTGFKARNDYPKGIVRVEFCELVSRNVGIKIQTQPIKQKSDTMKKVLPLIALLALFVTTASAQTAPVYASQTFPAFSVAATAGTNVGLVIDTRKQASVDIQIELMADASGAYTFTVPFQYSLDGITYAGMRSGAIAISFNGVTKQTVVTNIPTFGAGYVKIPHLTNATASIAVTNGIIKYGIKIP